MRSLDAFGKPEEEFRVKTAIGGYLSVCSIIVVLTLFFTELRYFLQLDATDELLIDQSQDLKYLNISFDVSFRHVSCSMLAMNLMDPKMSNVLHVKHKIFKTRLSRSGKQLGRRIRDSLANVAATTEQLNSAPDAEGTSSVRTSHATGHLRCPSCFQSHIDEDDCCMSCNEVREEFRKRGLDSHPKQHVFGQCLDEAYVEAPAEEGEGCELQAILHVRKVPAVIHLGVATHFRKDLVQAIDLKDLTQTLDFAHKINKLSFGADFPGLVHILDGRTKSSHQAHSSDHYNYDVHIIPTRFKEDGSNEINSHQYSVTEYMKPVSTLEGWDDQPATGLMMKYDFTPFEVKVTRSRKSLWHFATECCAILGGVFAFTGMLDNFAYQLDKKVASSPGRHGGRSVLDVGGT